MRTALQLGWQLATRATGHGRLRSGIMALVAAAGTLAVLALGRLVLVTSETADTSVVLDGESLVYSRALTGGVLLAVVLPVLVAAFSAGRMSASLRTRRLERLRLLGMSRRSLALVGLAETAPWALGGWAFGMLLAVVLGPLLSRLAGADAVSPAASAFLLAAGFAVPLMIELGALGPGLLRTRGGRATRSRARTGVDASPSPLRVLPLLAGIALLLVARQEQLGNGAVIPAFLAGAALAALGTVLLTPLLVRALSRVLVLREPPSATIAARRLQAQPAAQTRIIGALMIGLVVATAAQGLIAVVEQLPQYRAVEHSREVEARAESFAVPAGTTAASLRSELAEVEGIREVAIVQEALAPGLPGPEPFPEDGTSVVVATCAELLIVQPSLQGCRDDAPQWILYPPIPDMTVPQEGEAELRGTFDDNGRIGPHIATVHVDETTATIGPLAGPWQNPNLAGRLYVPRNLLTEAEVGALDSVRATVVADPRDDLAGELRAAGFTAHAGYDAAEFERWEHVIAMIRLLTLVVLALGLGGFLLSLTDRMLERRTELAHLRLLGTPVSTLRRAQALEIALPLLLGVLLAVAVGSLIADGYVTLGNRGADAESAVRLAQGYQVVPVLGAAIGAGVIVAVSSLGLGARLRPEMLRRP